MTLVLDGTTGVSGIDGSAAAPAIIGSDADTGIFMSAGQVSASLNGTAGNVPLVSGSAQNSTSGTAILFTGIPSWVKRITVMLNGVTMSAGNMMVQIGSGSLTTSGYVGGVASMGSSTQTQTSFTTGFGVFDATPTIHSGLIIITNVSGNIWVAQAVTSNASRSGFGGGTVTLGGTLDRVNITTVAGTATFSAGSINILYE